MMIHIIIAKTFTFNAHYIINQGLFKKKFSARLPYWYEIANTNVIQGH